MTATLDRQRVPRILADDGPQTWQALDLLGRALDLDLDACQTPADAFLQAVTALEHDGAVAALVAAYGAVQAGLRVQTTTSSTVERADGSQPEPHTVESTDVVVPIGTDPLAAMRATDAAQVAGSFLSLAITAGRIAAAERRSIDPALWAALDLDDQAEDRAAQLTADAVARSVAQYRTGDADRRAFPSRSTLTDAGQRGTGRGWNRQEQEAMRLAAVADRWAAEHGTADHAWYGVLAAYGRTDHEGGTERLLGTMTAQPVEIVTHDPIPCGTVESAGRLAAADGPAVPLFLRPECVPGAFSVPQDAGRERRGKRRTTRTPAGRIGQAVEVLCSESNGAARWLSPGSGRGRVIVPGRALLAHLAHGDRVARSERTLTLPTVAGSTVTLTTYRQAVRTTYRGMVWVGHERTEQSEQASALTTAVTRSRRTAEPRPAGTFDGVGPSGGAQLHAAVRRMTDRLARQARIALATMRPVAAPTGGTQYLVTPGEDGQRVTILGPGGSTEGEPSRAARAAVLATLR